MSCDVIKKEKLWDVVILSVLVVLSVLSLVVYEELQGYRSKEMEGSGIVSTLKSGKERGMKGIVEVGENLRFMMQKGGREIGDSLRCSSIGLNVNSNPYFDLKE